MIKRILFATKHKKRLYLLPTFLTFANACLGLFSIMQSLEDNYMLAAYFILFAAAMDFCDGRLARALGAQSNLGMELDSLSDAISFVLAPAVLLYSWTVSDFGMLGVAILAVYLCAGLFRLAKFNVTSDQQSQYFMGLPTPVAAFLVTSFVVYQEWLEASRVKFVYHKLWLISLIIFIAFLMVSKIQFPAFKQGGERSKFSLFNIFLILFPVGLLGLIYGYPVFLFMLIWYLGYGMFKTVYPKFYR
ncbi:CDP-diacylglycerol--serine O-phosphatidyltransferase [candidate division TM6 bacterium RIFCSPHIGHO2_12_FULL_36_22]|nr:MAG: CDP-diacylglycerol--serine O-phosphatidyltransferase [candidate division TM6 bacterium RIFCSPHIGHO2_12_FULL_36_22]